VVLQLGAWGYYSLPFKISMLRNVTECIGLGRILCINDLRIMDMKCGLRVFENRVLRRIFGPKRDEVTGGWRKLHNEELHNLYSSPSVIELSSHGG
jgi:hypothetical protein